MHYCEISPFLEDFCEILSFLPSYLNHVNISVHIKSLIKNIIITIKQTEYVNRAENTYRSLKEKVSHHRAGLAPRS